MSGGSYDYLHQRPLCERVVYVRQMRDRLRGLQHIPTFALAYQRTEEVLSMLVAAQAFADTLDEPWHAIEWWDSGDWGEDQAMEALAKWDREKRGWPR